MQSAGIACPGPRIATLGNHRRAALGPPIQAKGTLAGRSPGGDDELAVIASWTATRHTRMATAAGQRLLLATQIACAAASAWPCILQ